jgi:hypothetical protein
MSYVTSYVRFRTYDVRTYDVEYNIICLTYDVVRGTYDIVRRRIMSYLARIQMYVVYFAARQRSMLCRSTAYHAQQEELFFKSAKRRVLFDEIRAKAFFFSMSQVSQSTVTVGQKGNDGTNLFLSAHLIQKIILFYLLLPV